MANYPKISIVTVCRNHGDFLEDAILSLISQGYPNLEYIIVDGGSTDKTPDIIKKYEHHLSWWVSEPDAGPTDALQKGFAKTTGEIMGWLNADDRHQVNSLFAIAEIFSQHKNIDWIQGRPTWFNKDGVPLVEMPSSPAMRRYGIHGEEIQMKWALWSQMRYLNGDFLAIQQESTFWRRTLWEKAGSHVNTNYKYAYDMELWARFFRHTELRTVDTILAGFSMIGENQISRLGKDGYETEGREIIKKELQQLSLWQRINTRLKWKLSRILKPFYYMRIPVLRTIYRKLLGIKRPLILK